MRILQLTDNLTKLCKILQRGETGSMKNIAQIMNMDRSTVAIYIKELREMGAEIVFDKKQNSYYFNRPFEFKVQIKKD